MGSRLEQKSSRIRKHIDNHEFTNEDGEEYNGSKFGGFPEYFRRKKIKLQNLDAEIRSQSIDKLQIFKGVVCHVNGYTQPSLNDLHTMIVQHGGGFIQYLDGKTMVTHIIASNLTPKKKEEFRRYRIVKPGWIVDSIKAGALLPWDKYRVLHEGAGQQVLGSENGQIIGQTNARPQTYRDQTNVSWYTSQLRSQRNAPLDMSRQLSSAQPIPTNQVTGDDENPLPGVTSSFERALEDLDSESLNEGRPHLAQSPCNLLELQTELETTPSRSRKLTVEDSVDVSESDSQKPTFQGQISEEVHAKTAASPLQPREGSQEPDFAQAIITDSEVLRSMSPSKLANMTAEEHNAVLLSDPKIRKSTVVNPGFLEQYYRESRLHHLSTWKADLKSQLQAISATRSLPQQSKRKRTPGQRRYIMHVDFDSFFAAVSLRNYPQYKDKPVVVAHGGGSGSEIASCNYPAREFGISNGMWMKRAQSLCPDLKILPYDFPAYEEASRNFYDAIIATGGIVQSVSVDEALVDISDICFLASGQDGAARDEGAVDGEQMRADKLAQQVRDEVFAKTGCAVSVGIGANILQAKIALRKAKPAGQYQLRPAEVLNLIGSLEVQKLPGVAWSIGGKLEEIGVKFVKDIWDISREKLVATLGPKTGERIWDYSRGIDRTEVGEQSLRKSVSAEVNWGVRFQDQEQVDEFMGGLCDELHKRLIKEGVKGKQLTLKIMRRAADAPRDPPKHLGHGKCDVFNKSIHLGVATNTSAVMAKEAVALLKSFHISPGELRGIGVQMQKLEVLKQRAYGRGTDSQRQLQFRPEPSARLAAEVDDEKVLQLEDPIQDSATTPENPQLTQYDRHGAAFTPAVQGVTPSQKSLNILGSQFILPTQVDPTVLSELPAEIRTKLVNRPAQSSRWQNRPCTLLGLADDPNLVRFTEKEALAYTVPSPSQIDPTILDELPQDVREEILGLHREPLKRNEQAVLPQPPRQVGLISRSRPPAKRGRPRGSRMLQTRSRAIPSESHTLTQVNFVSRPLTKQPRNDVDDILDTNGELEGLDPEVLAALPEDLRKEILDQQRQVRLQRQGGINLSLHQRSKVDRKGTDRREPGPLDAQFELPPRHANPTFTSKKLSALADLRKAVTAWVTEFRDDGPYEEDTLALVQYLCDVVLEEHDLFKAVAVAKWLAWTIDERDDLPQNVHGAWRAALETIKAGIQGASAKRGLASIDFA